MLFSEFNRLKSINYPFSTTVHYDYGAMGEAYNRAGRIKEHLREHLRTS